MPFCPGDSSGYQRRGEVHRKSANKRWRIQSWLYGNRFQEKRCPILRPGDHTYPCVAACKVRGWLQGVLTPHAEPPPMAASPYTATQPTQRVCGQLDQQRYPTEQHLKYRSVQYPPSRCRYAAVCARAKRIARRVCPIHRWCDLPCPLLHSPCARPAACPSLGLHSSNPAGASRIARLPAN